MKIEVDHISKRYGLNWVLKDIWLLFDKNIIYGLKGPNGSGKSTLLQLISGYLTPSKGVIRYWEQAKSVSRDDIYKFLVFAAPYTDLIEEFTIEEIYRLQKIFKGKFEARGNLDSFVQFCGLARHRHKPIKQYSSGMRQRLKLSLAFHSKAPILLLDEPSSYFDENNRQWFYENLNLYSKDRMTIIATNDPEDLNHCHEIIDIKSL